MTLGHQAALRLSPSGSCAELYCLASRPAPGLSAWAQLRSCAVVADASSAAAGGLQGAIVGSAADPGT